MRDILDNMCVKSITAVSLMMCFSVGVYAQTRSTDKLKSAKRYKMASHMVSNQSYYNASSELKTLIGEYNSDTKYLDKLAESYFLSRDYQNAEQVYAALVKLDTKNLTLDRFRYAECLKYNAKYELAIREFESFYKSGKYKDPHNISYKQYAAQEIKSCGYALANVEHVAKEIEINHLGNEINSAYSDFAPYVSRQGDTLIFASHQEDSVIEVHSSLPHNNYVRLYKSVYIDNRWTALEQLPDVLDHDYMNTTNAVFSTDHKRLYFTRCYPVKQGMHCDVYMSRIEKGKFGKPVRLKQINSSHHSTTQPQLAQVKSGKSTKEVLFFASDRKNGTGGMDIWYSYLDAEGQPGTPINAGKKINSIRDEITPFYDAVTEQLYFSSNYHAGFGGYDVFKVKGNLKTWSAPQNLGQPVNTSVDDTYFRPVPENQQTGFLVSNRPGGYHLTSETCCDDIYRFEIFPVESDTLDVLPVTELPREEPETIVENEETFTCTRLGKDIKVKDRKGLKVILNYDFDDTDFIDRHTEDLDCMVELLREYKDIKVKVTAHTDNKGAAHYNMKLSKQRANTIQTYLIRHGVASDRVQMEYFGETKPLVSNEHNDGSDNEENRALNRRAEIIIVN